MSRPLLRRYTLHAPLIAASPLHVGAGTEGPASDLAVQRDGTGAFVLPGPGLAGACRAWLRPLGLDRLFGPRPEGAASPDAGASLVVVDDAELRTPAHASLTVRASTAIDERRGTAASGSLHDREILPRGTRFDVDLTVDVGDESDDPAARRLLASLVAGLAGGCVRIGGGRTRGFGRVRSADEHPPTCRCLDLSSPHGLLRTLKGGDVVNIDTLGPPTLPGSWLEMELTWKPTGPLLVSADTAGLAVDVVPLTELLDDGAVALLLPWSSVKGALRSHAGRIARTVRPAEAEQLVTTLFGGAPTGQRAVPSAIDGNDVQARTTMTQSTWEQVLLLKQPRKSQRTRREQDHPPADAYDKHVADLAGSGLRPVKRVAIDRWTSGALDGALYSVLEPQQVTWEPIRLRIDLDRLGRQPDLATPALALLVIALADVAAGLVPLGYGTNRGFGDVTADRLQVTPVGGQTLTQMWSRHGEAIPFAPETGRWRLGEAVHAALAGAWGTWSRP